MRPRDVAHIVAAFESPTYKCRDFHNVYTTLAFVGILAQNANGGRYTHCSCEPHEPNLHTKESRLRDPPVLLIKWTENAAGMTLHFLQGRQTGGFPTGSRGYPKVMPTGTLSAPLALIV